ATASVSGSPVPGTFSYTPAEGTVLGAGLNQTLDVTFIPTDRTYATATARARITVTPAPLTVTAGGGTKAYGTADPALTATATGFKAADALTIALTATPPGVALSNYTVTYVAGSFSITKGAAAVTAHDGTKAYGAADPALGATATGFTAADGLTIAVSATRAAGEAVGDYVTTATAT